ncbi:MAG: hypothetical protein L0209_08940 [candidate division Zixibacteria bacterium]|nr:hypothetical protein [candidate division Zixibacteria bacterium]
MKVAVLVGFFLLVFTSLSISQPVFAPPVNLGPTINTSAVESDPFWDGPRNLLYFVRDFDIWYAQWNGTAWDPPIKLGPQINTGAGIEQSPSVSSDGQKLYFVYDLKDGYLWDIWVSNWNSSINDWGTPVNVGPPVNTPGVEFSAHLAPYGRIIFTSTNDPDSLFPQGRCGIYMSESNGTSWSVPQAQWGCGDPEYPTVAADGQWLYFAEFVSDGQSIKAVAWDGLGWVFPVYDLRQQIGGRAGTPFITPSGDSLFFASGDIGGFGAGDIWLAKRIVPGNVPALSKEYLFFLILVLTFAGAYWIATRNQRPANE